LRAKEISEAIKFICDLVMNVQILGEHDLKEKIKTCNEDSEAFKKYPILRDKILRNFRNILSEYCKEKF